MLLLALIFVIGEFYLIANYTRFEIWANTDEKKSMLMDFANTILKDSNMATHRIIFYSSMLDHYNGKELPNLKLCEYPYKVTVKGPVGDPNSISTWSFTDNDLMNVVENTGMEKIKASDKIDVPILISGSNLYTDKTIVLPGIMEIVLYDSVYRKIVCHLKSTLLSKNEKFSIGCVNRTQDGRNCKIILSKKYSDGTTQDYHICFDKKCDICESVSKSVYLALGSGKASDENSDCEIIFNETYYDFPGSGIMKVNITGNEYNFDVYKNVKAKK